MDAEKLRSLFDRINADHERANGGGAFERPPELPPYLVPAGYHAIDKRLANETLDADGVEIAKFGYGTMVGDSVPVEPSGSVGPNALPSADDVHTLFTMAGALFSPYDPEVLSSLQEHSSSLRPNVDAYKTNIDGFGYKLEPVIDLDDPDANEKIGDALYLDRLRDAELQGKPAVPYPSDEEIGQYKLEVRALMRLERSRLEHFLAGCSAEISFKELRRRTREDHEITGNAYWEVIRNGENEIAEFHFVPSYSMRLAPIEHVIREVQSKRKVSPFRYEKTKVKRRFRRYIQVVLDRIVYFKEFGDPRVISKRTGRVYPNAEELAQQSQHDGPATEILHFRIFSPRSPYGVPRWIGNLLSVLGSRASEEVNYLYFDNKAVPPLALLVSGGKLAPAAVKKIESYIADNVRGKENFHRILVIEAEPAGAGNGTPQVESGRVRIDLVPLRDAQQDDSLFQGYDTQNRDKVGQSFRLPRLLRGDTLDFNRATADAALELAEMQVFEGEREGFDDIVNLRLFSELGIRFWVFHSNSPVNRDASDLTTNVVKIHDSGIITTEEAREIAGDVFNRKLGKIAGSWVKQPMCMTLGGFSTDPDTGAVTATTPPADGAVPKTADGETPPLVDSAQRQRDLVTLAGRVMALRDELAASATKGYRTKLAKRTEDESKPTLTLRVDSATFRDWFERMDDGAKTDAPPAH